MPETTFEQWMEAVDREVLARIGFSVHDLADAPFRDIYDGGGEPAEAADEVLEREGLDPEDF